MLAAQSMATLQTMASVMGPIGEELWGGDLEIKPGDYWYAFGESYHVRLTVLVRAALDDGTFNVRIWYGDGTCRDDSMPRSWFRGVLLWRCCTIESSMAFGCSFRNHTRPWYIFPSPENGGPPCPPASRSNSSANGGPS